MPCVACNQTVKFADLLETAPPARRRCAGDRPLRAFRSGAAIGRALYRPVDLERDQSYFLFATTREQLDFLRFPLGAMTKAETRAAAREFGLAVADKHDSQDICFVPTGRYADVIAAAEAGRGRGRRDRPHRRPRARPPRRHHPLHGRPAARHRRRRRRAALRRPSRPGGPARHRRSARGADDAPAASARRQLAGRRAARRARRPRASTFIARVRSTRPPLPARLSTDDGACLRRPRRRRGRALRRARPVSSTTATAPAARVLGGGWIERAEHDRRGRDSRCASLIARGAAVHRCEAE